MPSVQDPFSRVWTPPFSLAPNPGATYPRIEDIAELQEALRRAEQNAVGTGSGAAVDHPFRVVSAGVGVVRVVFGQVNSVTPTIGGVALDHSPAPTLSAASGVVYLRANLDVDGVVTSAVIANAGSLPADTATEGYITLATITGSTINQSVTHSLALRRCGVSDMHFWGV